MGSNSASLQGVVDGITVAPTPGVSSVNVDTDELWTDSYWSIVSPSGSVSTLIVELGGYKNGNIFGVYSGSDYVTLFGGSAAAGAQSLLEIMVDGSVYVNNTDTGVDFAGHTFGYFLDSSAFTYGGLFHSDTSLNSDQADHMAAYQGTGDTVVLPGYSPSTWTSNDYILAFEDLTATAADFDYDDMVVMVESVKPIPEPATMLLFGTGLIGAGLFGTRRRSKQS